MNKPTLKSVYCSILMMFAILSLALTISLVINYDTLPYSAELADKMFLTSIAMSLVFATMGFTMASDFKHGTVWSLFLSLIFFMLAVGY